LNNYITILHTVVNICYSFMYSCSSFIYEQIAISLSKFKSIIAWESEGLCSFSKSG